MPKASSLIHPFTNPSHPSTHLSTKPTTHTSTDSSKKKLEENHSILHPPTHPSTLRPTHPLTHLAIHLISPHLSLNGKGCWGTTDDFTTNFLHFFSVLHCSLGLGELQSRPFPDVVFPPLFLSAFSSSPFHCALQDGSGQT